MFLRFKEGSSSLGLYIQFFLEKQNRLYIVNKVKSLIQKLLRTEIEGPFWTQILNNTSKQPTRWAAGVAFHEFTCTPQILWLYIMNHMQNLPLYAKARKKFYSIKCPPNFSKVVMGSVEPSTKSFTRIRSWEWALFQ